MRGGDRAAPGRSAGGRTVHEIAPLFTLVGAVFGMVFMQGYLGRFGVDPFETNGAPTSCLPHSAGLGGSQRQHPPP